MSTVQQINTTEIVDILNEKGYVTNYVSTIEEARDQVISMLPKGCSLALGGSVTLNEMGMIDIARNGDYKFFDRYEEGKPFIPDIVNVYRESLTADYLVTGTNAITVNGELVNVDCSGNRVSSMMFGAKNVIIVAGVNKIVDSLDAAMAKLREIAPKNAKRIGHKTPCVTTGVCEDCQTPERMCNYTTIIHNGRKFEGRINIILVGQELGY